MNPQELQAWCLWCTAGDRWVSHGSGFPPCESQMGPAIGCCHFVALNGPFLSPGKCQHGVFQCLLSKTVGLWMHIEFQGFGPPAGV